MVGELNACEVVGGFVTVKINDNGEKSFQISQGNGKDVHLSADAAFLKLVDARAHILENMRGSHWNKMSREFDDPVFRINDKYVQMLLKGEELIIDPQDEKNKETIPVFAKQYAQLILIDRMFEDYANKKLKSEAVIGTATKILEGNGSTLERVKQENISSEEYEVGKKGGMPVTLGTIISAEAMTVSDIVSAGK
jgi:hypothetical protein